MRALLGRILLGHRYRLQAESSSFCLRRIRDGARTFRISPPAKGPTISGPDDIWAPRHLEGCAPAQPLARLPQTTSQGQHDCPGGQPSIRRWGQPPRDIWRVALLRNRSLSYLKQVRNSNTAAREGSPPSSRCRPPRNIERVVRERKTPSKSGGKGKSEKLPKTYN